MNIRILIATSSFDEILFLREVFEDIEAARHWRGWAGIQALQATSLDDAIAILTDEPVDAVLLDLDLCGERAVDAFGRLQASAPRTPIVLLAHPEDSEVAVRLIREGAQDFLITGQIDAVPLAHALGNAMERHRLFAGARAGCLEDSLTGLWSATAFRTLADRDRRLAERLGCRWMVALAEPRNDPPQHSPPHSILDVAHQRRDLLLIQTAEELRQLAGPTDLLARIGDLRFGLGIFDTSTEPIEAAWLRIHAAADQSGIALGGAIFDAAHPLSLEVLIEQAGLDLAPKAMAMRT
jgi:DNA-binding NarL/FixJ family response regulator